MNLFLAVSLVFEQAHSVGRQRTPLRFGLNGADL